MSEEEQLRVDGAEDEPSKETDGAASVSEGGGQDFTPQARELPFADLEVPRLDQGWAQPVLVISTLLILIIILLHQVDRDLFMELQKEDTNTEILTVVFLLVALVGMGRRLGRLWVHFKDSRERVDRKQQLWTLMVFLQLLGLALVALYAGLQEMEFGQRSLNYGAADEDTEDSDLKMNYHNVPVVEVIISFGAVVIILYTVIFPHLTRPPWYRFLPGMVDREIQPWLLKLPRSLVPAFFGGALFFMFQGVSLLFGDELTEFNEYSEFCFALGFGLLGVYLWLDDNPKGPFR